MVMVKRSPTRIVNYNDLYTKNLITDLKEVTTCKVRTVCSLACNRCPYVVENVDVEKIKVEGLNTYTIKFEKVKNEQLLISITAPDIDSWLLKNNLPSTTPKAMIRRKKKRRITRLPFVNRCRELI
jgi:hypothetical protein